MAWPSRSPRARLVRSFKWHLAEWRLEFASWATHALELDRAQREAFHSKLRSIVQNF